MIKNSRTGLNYLGSKKAIAKDILLTISKTLNLKDNSLFSGDKDFNYFYDLFGGGGSISFIVAENFRGKKVIYNDLSASYDFIALLRDSEQLPEFIHLDYTKEDFYRIKAERDSPQRIFVLSHFSWGGNRDKFATEEYLISNNEKRRGLEAYNNVMNFDYSNLELSKQDYKSVTIENNSIVYLDPPYRDTVNYEVPFDYEEFIAYSKSLTVPVFVSEYNNPDDSYFVEVFNKKKKRGIPHNGNNKYRAERLFWNQIKLRGER